MSRRFSIVSVTMLGLLLCSVGFAQTITASLQGRVQDKSGAVLPKATVTATNTETGFSRSATSSDSGEYKISSLPAGNYKVTVQAATFQPQTRVLQLSIGDTASVDFSLSPGEVEQPPGQREWMHRNVPLELGVYCIRYDFVSMCGNAQTAAVVGQVSASPRGSASPARS